MWCSIRSDYRAKRAVGGAWWVGVGLLCLATAFGQLRVTDLKCEFAVDPLGIDVAQPRLFWRVASEARGERQTSWQVLVASSGIARG